MSLHRALSVFIVVIATLTVSAGISLVLLTRYLHHATVGLEDGLRSIRLAEEMQIDLLTYVRTSDELARDRVQSDLQQKLQQAAEYVNTPEEHRSLSEAGRLLDSYFAEPPSPSHEGTLRKAFSALTAFVNMKAGRADASMEQSERLDAVGGQIGIAVAIGLAIATAAILIWLRQVAFRPVFQICRTMNAFAVHDKGARADINAPEEFRIIATQFNQMADALAQQHHNQAAFLAAIAHDLRNPIAALKVAADILSGPGATTDRISKLMAVIKRQTSSLDRLVSDLLDSAKIESGHLDLKFEELDAREIAQDAFNLFSSVSTNHEFNLILSEQPAPLCCDRLRIEQVLNNLLSNAIKYSPAGGRVTLSLKANDEDERLFQVSDEGIGIRQEDMLHIFEPFHRTQSVRENIPGVGLGLSVAQRIIRAHGGWIEVESEIGRGTTFSVHLPSAILRQASA